MKRYVAIFTVLIVVCSLVLTNAAPKLKGWYDTRDIRSDNKNKLAWGVNIKQEINSSVFDQDF